MQLWGCLPYFLMEQPYNLQVKVLIWDKILLILEQLHDLCAFKSLACKVFRMRSASGCPCTKPNSLSAEPGDEIVFDLFHWQTHESSDSYGGMEVEEYESKFATGLTWPWASCLVWDMCVRSRVDSSKRSDGDPLALLNIRKSDIRRASYERFVLIMYLSLLHCSAWGNWVNNCQQAEKKHDTKTVEKEFLFCNCLLKLDKIPLIKCLSFFLTMTFSSQPIFP